MAQVTTVVTTQPGAAPRDWSSGVFGCFEDMKSCKCSPYISPLPPYISPLPPYISPPVYKPIEKGLRTNISPGLIFGGLRYSRAFRKYWDVGDRPLPTPLPHPLAPPPVSIVHHCFLTGSVFTLGLFGFCCPCCFMISLSQRMGEGCCFPICCPGALLAMRVKLRSENGIQVRYSTTSIPILFINEPDVFLTH